MGACTRRIAAASTSTKANLPSHRSSQPRCLVHTLPAGTRLGNRSSVVRGHEQAVTAYEHPIARGQPAFRAVPQLLGFVGGTRDARNGERGPLPEIVVVDLGDRGAEAIPELCLGRGDVLALPLQRAGLGEMQLDREDADVTGSVQVVAAAVALSSRPVRSIARVS